MLPLTMPIWDTESWNNFLTETLPTARPENNCIPIIVFVHHNRVHNVKWIKEN